MAATWQHISGLTSYVRHLLKRRDSKQLNIDLIKDAEMLIRRSKPLNNVVMRMAEDQDQRRNLRPDARTPILLVMRGALATKR
jgi:hypothetical protein